MAAIAASIAGDAAPGRLNEASCLALAELQRERCSAPGDGVAIQAAQHHVEVEGLPAPLVLHLVDETHPGRDADPGKALRKAQRQAAPAGDRPP